jgi:hypothetical protein
MLFSIPSPGKGEGSMGLSSQNYATLNPHLAVFLPGILSRWQPIEFAKKIELV